MRVCFNKKSGNKKTGEIPVSMTERKSCPKSCPWYNKGCYALYGPINLHWKKADNFGLTWNKFCRKISELPANQIWRHNSAGDLPGTNDKINKKLLDKLLIANRNKCGFTYTHKPVVGRGVAVENRNIIRQANKKGFCINLSASSVKEADTLRGLNIGPVTIVLPIGFNGKCITPNGNRIVICPAQKNKNITCNVCKLCSNINRKSIVGFIAHGAAFKYVSNKTKQYSRTKF